MARGDGAKELGELYVHEPRVATAVAVRPEEKGVHQNRQRVEDPHLMHRKMRVSDPPEIPVTTYTPQVSPLRGQET